MKKQIQGRPLQLLRETIRQLENDKPEGSDTECPTGSYPNTDALHP
ncbi:MAG TPA: hypothetical protein VFE33_05100 [Thermoanaerobaculia bacterium]|nr:hypothetical protein [Thermoanaerobaculia bacterium]